MLVRMEGIAGVVAELSQSEAGREVLFPGTGAKVTSRMLRSVISLLGEPPARRIGV